MAVRIWRPGRNDSTKGPVFFTARSAELIMCAYRDRGMPLAWDYEHESSVPPEQRPVAASAGYGEASAKFSALELRGSDGSGESFDQELWSTRIEWTDHAREQIVSGKRRQVSPYFATEKSSREIVELYSMALCFEGATNRGVILTPQVPRLHSRGTGMDEIRAQLAAAIEAQDWEAVKAVLDALSAMAVPSNNPDAVLTALQALPEQIMAKFTAWSNENKPQAEAHSRPGAPAQPSTDVLDVRRDRIAAMIEREAAGTIGPELERVLLSRADPELAKQVIADAKRPQRHARTPIVPPAGGDVDDKHGLTPEEIETARKSGLTAEQYKKGKQNHAAGRGARKGR